MRKFTTLFVLFTILFVVSSATASDRAKLRGRSAWAWASCQQCQPAKVENKPENPDMGIPISKESTTNQTCTTGNCSSYPMVGGGIFRMRRR